MSRKRAQYTPEEKVAILRRHLVEKVPVSELCEELGLGPNVFYRWQKEFFENGAAAFQRRPQAAQPQYAQQIEALKQKLQKKDEVLGELMGEYVALKKSLGDV